MSQAPQMQREKRGARVKLGGSVLALLQLQNRRQIRTRLSQLSANGGLLQLEKPLDEGIVVEVLFHVGSTTVRSQAEMLFPMWATKGCLQPFRFKDLEDAMRVSLEEELNGLLKASPGAVADDTNLP
ncbi:MAG: hypothetical protein DMG83_18170 [Acidobacteria bacterium]|nr:MAG: hypothetical protein DMG83_18170 [Acidobacteriota bacterium]